MNTLLVLAVLFLAAANGANDNFKGVAALYGSGTASYRASLIFASLTTLAGALSSAYLATALLSAFTGKGLVVAAIAGQSAFAMAVAGGAAITVALAAWRGLPISTTHALVGAMTGAALLAVGGAVRFGTLGSSFLLPLLAAPVLALLPAWIIGKLLLRWLPGLSPVCVCEQDELQVSGNGVVLRGNAGLVVDRLTECEKSDARPLLKLDQNSFSRYLQFLFSGIVSFARGLNDTPKIAALLLPIAALDKPSAVAAVAVAMLAGGLIGARRVAQTMSLRITRLDHRSALAASLVTGLLVGTASVNGLPVSTTHVSVGALVGSGKAAGGRLDGGTLGGILSAWLITLPFAAIMGALIYLAVAGKV